MVAKVFKGRLLRQKAWCASQAVHCRFGTRSQCMSKPELDNLVRIERLKSEPPTSNEYLGMVAAARSRLTDAQNEDLDPDSRFDLAYGAAHRLALAALRREGYRSENRITVFQTLVHTVGNSSGDIQIFLAAHNARNLSEYQGSTDIDPKLLADLIDCTKRLEAAVAKLEPPKGDE